MSRSVAVKYARIYAKELGIDGLFNAKGVDDNTAYNAFCQFMGDRANEESSTYWNISHQLYLWHSLASVRKMEHSWGFGIRPPKSAVDLMVYGYRNGSTSPKFKGTYKEYQYEKATPPIKGKD